MIWKNCVLTKPDTTADVLGNNVPSGTETTVATTIARESPFTLDEIKADSRILTKNQQRFILPLPFADIEDAKYATIGEVKQTIVEKQNLSPRWSVIIVEKYRA